MVPTAARMVGVRSSAACWRRSRASLVTAIPRRSAVSVRSSVIIVSQANSFPGETTAMSTVRPMYPGEHAKQRADEPAFIMANSGEVVTFRQYEERANQLAHLYRAQGLRKRDHVAFFFENNPRMLECEGGAERSGLYYTCINSYLAPDEVAYIIN